MYIYDYDKNVIGIRLLYARASGFARARPVTAARPTQLLLEWMHTS